ncbi:hypothetical protein HaLaN_18195 [Haematococcus lacustris]|uniref:Uncharacterized protein n=1 Tax=Haematococcus lacustris TaxID=44745 RepID=A0A699ZEC5_HAELA|nr:hypothetical protein HaLaN_18195 [Haematococcus lacustris]
MAAAGGRTVRQGVVRGTWPAAAAQLSITLITTARPCSRSCKCAACEEGMVSTGAKWLESGAHA